jgi:protein SCO1/2/putative membrane protein
VLNGTAAILLATGFYLIKNGKREAHKRVMLTAFCTSILFLISYLTYHAQIGSKHYTGPIPAVYYTILISHTLLAVTVPVLAIITLRRALKGNFAGHRKLAKWTWPIWMYVSVTGVVVYLMLYQL